MARSRIIIDLDICIRAGQCFYMHPKLVAMREDGYPMVIGAVLTADRALEEAGTLVDVCPVGAITLEALE